MRFALLVLVGLSAFGTAVPTYAAEFHPIGSGVSDVSADGSVVVGGGFRWTAEAGVVALQPLPDHSRGYASGVSADGSMIVGQSASGTRSEAVYWTAPDRPVGLGYLDEGPGWKGGSAAAVSGDRSVVVGVSTSLDGDQAFRWTAESGMIGLGDLPGRHFRSGASDISTDGSTIVGSGNSEDGTEAFRWTETEAMVGLGALPGGGIRSTSGASAVSADGSVIVGSSGAAAVFEHQAYRWTADTGMVLLGVLDGDEDSRGRDVSGDGSLIVGKSRRYIQDTPFGYWESRAFLWSESLGMRSLQELLTDDLGLDLTGWSLEEATAISADGRVIVGFGRNPAGQIEPWRAVIPEPSTLVLLSIGAIALAAYAWQWRKTNP